jgi:hypothetical protein
LRTHEMFAVMDREERLLTDDNWHASAAIMRDAAQRLRDHRDVMRRVERWWVAEGMHKFDRAPECMFALRQALNE